MRTIFKHNEWVCEIANGTINNIEQVWIVDSQEENQVIAKQWYKKKEMREKVFDCNELRRITLSEFINVLSKHNNLTEDKQWSKHGGSPKQ